jgi:hypothetical protein
MSKIKERVSYSERVTTRETPKVKSKYKKPGRDLKIGGKGNVEVNPETKPEATSLMQKYQNMDTGDQAKITMGAVGLAGDLWTSYTTYKNNQANLELAKRSATLKENQYNVALSSLNQDADRRKGIGKAVSGRELLTDEYSHLNKDGTRNIEKG